MSKSSQTITSLPVSPEEDRRHRMISYTIMMVIRVTCFVLLIVTDGIWQWVFAAGAIFLPYFAVVIANNTADLRAGRVEDPAAPLPLPAARPSSSGEGAGGGEQAPAPPTGPGEPT